MSVSRTLRCKFGEPILMSANRALRNHRMARAGDTEKRQHIARALGWGLALMTAITFAAYAGFRLPNLWSVTLYNIALRDGTARRAALGTLLAPIWALGGYRYGIYAAVAYVVLALIIVVLVFAFFRARTDAQRLLLLSWLLAPTGGYLFHEVGYLDQVLYLMLFLTLWSWRRMPPLVAVLPITVAAFVHEAALLTVFPVLVWLTCYRKAARAEWTGLLVPVAAFGIVFTLPPLGPSRVAALQTRLAGVLPFAFRPDAIALFGRTQQESWALYSMSDGVARAAPFALSLAAFWFVVGAVFGRGRPRSYQVSIAGFAASAAPLLLLFAGWDFERWVFLAVSNFALILYIWFQHERAEPPARLLGWAALPFALLLLLPLGYFDGYAPRKLTPSGIHRAIQNPDFLKFPQR